MAATTTPLMILAYKAKSSPMATLPQMFDTSVFGIETPVVSLYTDDGYNRLHPAPLPVHDQDFLDSIGICRCCPEEATRCCNLPTLLPPLHRRPAVLGPIPRPATTPKTLQRGKSNADENSDKMEGTGVGALGVSAAATTTALSENPQLPTGCGDGLIQPDMIADGTLPQGIQDQQSYSQPPQTPHTISNVQQSDALDTRPETPATERVASILANGPLHALAGGTASANAFNPASMGFDNMANGIVAPESLHRGSDAENWSIPIEEAFDAQPQNTQGFAKLMFADGDYIVTTHDVELGRNMEVAEHYRQEQKEKRRAQQREQRRERVPPAQKELAQRELEMYQQEPSQPSLPGDDAQHGEVSNSSHSLEGRPAPPSTFSEAGGALAFAQDSDDEAGRRRGRKKRRSMQYSKSSTSTTSVVPANLHPPVMRAEYSQQDLFMNNGEPYTRTLAVLPIHTQQPEDIMKISKRHLLFSYNFPEECWELTVLGNGAFVNEAMINRGDTIPLSHNDEIQIYTVSITFKLPDSHRSSPGLSRGTFSQNGLEDMDDVSTGRDGVGTSPVRRLSNAFDDAQSSDEENQITKKGKPTIKLDFKKLQKDKKASNKKKMQDDEKAGGKNGVKKQQRRQSNDSPSPETEKKAVKAEKGKKPKEASKQPADSQVVESIEEVPAPTPFAPEPGSALAAIPVDELPAKRKGPGRPPKNGLVSKRDQALVKKKEREYEKAGFAPPAFNVILDMVRKETKQKEMLAKMQNGTLPPGTEMPPAVDPDLAAAAVKAPSVPTPADNGEQTGDASNEAARRPSSPRPKRIARSPSPMKPESAYTEEDMKKPSATYVHILDEILRDHPTGQADLQEIYDRIQKRYPYFKYKVTTQGWQSSVRHNLLSATRFKETGRSGKGKLWTIDYDVPLEREKKKKPTPPPRPMPPMINGQYSGYGQQPYGNGYGPSANGQRPVNGGPGYYSPYTHGQQPGGQTMPNRHGASPAGQAQPGQANDPFGGLVPEILAVRTAFLAPYTNEANVQSKSEWIGKCIMVFSNRFHGSGDQPELTVETPDEKKAYADLDAVFQKYEALKAKQQQAQQAAASAPSMQATSAAPPVYNNGVSADAGGQSAPAQRRSPTVQTAVADGVAYQSANGGLSSATSHAPVAAVSGQSTAGAVHGQTYPVVGGAPNGSTALQSISGTQAPLVSQSLSTSSTPSYSVSTMPHAPPPQSVPSEPQSGVQHGAFAGRTPTPATGPSPVQPYHAPAQPSQQNEEKTSSPPAFIQHGSTTTTTPMPQVSGPPVVQTSNNGSTQSVPRIETKAAVPSPPAVEPLTPGAGTKRAAEDDDFAENESKRTKME